MHPEKAHCLQAADSGEIQLVEQRSEQRPPLQVILPNPPVQPTPEGLTPLSSLGGRGSQGLTPVAGPEPCRDTALFYNGLFRSSFRRGLQGQPWLYVPVGLAAAHAYCYLHACGLSGARICIVMCAHLYCRVHAFVWSCACSCVVMCMQGCCVVRIFVLSCACICMVMCAHVLCHLHAFVLSRACNSDKASVFFHKAGQTLTPGCSHTTPVAQCLGLLCCLQQTFQQS